MDIGLRSPSFAHEGAPFRFNLVPFDETFLILTEGSSDSHLLPRPTSSLVHRFSSTSLFQPGLSRSIWKVTSRLERPLNSIVALINRSFNHIALSYKQEFVPHTTVFEIPTYKIRL
jgi:hypothetical protein